MKHHSAMLWLLGLLASLLLPAMARAFCQSNQLNIGSGSTTLTSPADRQIGQQIPNWTGSVTNQNVFQMDVALGVGSGCSGSPGADLAYADPLGVPTGMTYTDPSTGKSYTVYRTNEDDIGYIVGIRDYKAPASAEMPLNAAGTQTYPYSGSSTGAQSTIGYQARVLLIVTKRLRNGSHTISPMQIAKLWVKNSAGNTVPSANYLVLNQITLSANASGCTVNAPQDLVIDMPDVAIGTTDLAQVSSGTFVVYLMCDAGVTVYATLTDMSNPGNTSTILHPNANATAQGLGIQLYKKGESVPTAYGPDSSAPGNTNQWFVAGSASAPGTSYGIPFVAKYAILPGYGLNNIKGGYFEAAASITFSYQ